MARRSVKRRVNRTLAFPETVARLVEQEARRERKSFNAVVVDIVSRKLGARTSGVAAFAREYVTKLQAEPGFRRPAPAAPFDRDDLYER